MKVEAYDVETRYLFKTGFDSYVLGTISELCDGEIKLRAASIQIPKSKIEKFVVSGQDIKDIAVHSTMILPRVNIDWAVPIK